MYATNVRIGANLINDKIIKIFTFPAAPHKRSSSDKALSFSTLLRVFQSDSLSKNFWSCFRSLLKVKTGNIKTVLRNRECVFASQEHLDNVEEHGRAKSIKTLKISLEW